MFSLEKNNKIVKKILKKVNKSISKDKHYLGRYVIRGCFYPTKNKNKENLIIYYFECIDKESRKRMFYHIESYFLTNKETIDSFKRQLLDIINNFSNVCPSVPKKNYRHIKID